MKIFHISDLHIGKQLHGFSLIGDQRYILNQILQLIRQEGPRVLLIAGDVYDKSIPSTEAVELLDEFLTALSGVKDLDTFLISGNHDSDRRLDFAGRILAKQHIHVAGTAPGKQRPEIYREVLKDEEGEVYFYLLPFVKPSYVRELYPDKEIHTYEQALSCLTGPLTVDPGCRNVLVAHQFFKDGGWLPEGSDSETFRVGGQDSVDISVFGDKFDYVALGHLHAPQHVGREWIRYSGSPLKYSVSEERQKKSVTMVELGRKGSVDIKKLPLVPLREVKSVRGSLREVLASAGDGGCQDYVSVTLTDEQALYEPGNALRRSYPNLLEWKLDNARTRYEMEMMEEEASPQSPEEIFGEFYEQMQGVPMQGPEISLLRKILEQAGGAR